MNFSHLIKSGILIVTITLPGLSHAGFGAHGGGFWVCRNDEGQITKMQSADLWRTQAEGVTIGGQTVFPRVDKSNLLPDVASLGADPSTCEKAKDHWTLCVARFQAFSAISRLEKLNSRLYRALMETTSTIANKIEAELRSATRNKKSYSLTPVMDFRSAKKPTHSFCGRSESLAYETAVIAGDALELAYEMHYGKATREKLRKAYLMQLSSSGRRGRFTYERPIVEVAPELLGASIREGSIDVTQTDFAALLLHEGVYALLRITLGIEHSDLASELTGLLLSTEDDDTIFRKIAELWSMTAPAKRINDGVYPPYTENPFSLCYIQQSLDTWARTNAGYQDLYDKPYVRKVPAGSIYPAEYFNGTLIQPRKSSNQMSASPEFSKCGN